jgi:hypothetical protein
MLAIYSCALYELTPAEVSIAISLLNGLSVSEMAAQNVVNLKAART